MSTHLTRSDNDLERRFWEIAASPSFLSHFQNSGHPFLRENGGTDFYNSTSLTARIQEIDRYLLAGCMPKNRYLLSMRRDVLSSWLLMTEFIEQHLVKERRHPYESHRPMNR